MPDASQSEIGILPCPGGMIFAQKIYAQLEAMASEKLHDRVAKLSRLYKLPRAEVVRQINLATDIQPSSGDLD